MSDTPAPQSDMETLVDAAQAPASISNKTEHVDGHPIPDLIAYDRYLRERAANDAAQAVNNPLGQVPFVQFELPGACR